MFEDFKISIAGDLDVEQTKLWIDKYFASIPKGQAINLYRDFINLSDGDFEKRHGISKAQFDANDFMSSKSPEAKKMFAKVITPVRSEVEANPRSRSAKMRVYRKLR